MTATPPGSAPLPELVVKALGRIALVGLLIGGGLIYLALRSPGPVDPAVTGVIGTFLAITSVAVGGLGAILSTTRSASDPPSPVTVVNAAADPAPTTDTPAPAKTTARKTARRKPRADKGESFVWWVLVVLAVAVGILLAHVIIRAV